MPGLPGDGASKLLVHNAQIPKVDAMFATARPIFVVRGTATPTILTTPSIMPPRIPRSPITIVPNIVDNTGHDAFLREHRGRAGLEHRGRAGHLRRTAAEPDLANATV